MKKWILLLTGLLSVQIVLAVTVNISSRDYSAFEATEKLLNFEASNIDHITIENGDSQLVITKQNDLWVLPDEESFPVAVKQVNDLLAKLSELQKGLPVATSDAALRRFKVDPVEFERKLTLSMGEQQVAQLLVGSSAGFRKAYVRPIGEEAVYSVEINTWDIGVESSDWIEKSILQLVGDQVTRIEMPEYSLTRENGKLSLANLVDEEETNEDAAESLLDKLVTLRVDGLANSDEAANLTSETAKLQIKVSMNEGEPLLYRFWEPEKASYFLLKRSDRSHTFKVAKHLVEALSGTGRETLVLKQDEASPESSEEMNQQTEAVDAG
ncbi:MAG: DUF4340 domain-containing protein [Candidatus Thiodiazotropha sp.]